MLIGEESTEKAQRQYKFIVSFFKFLKAVTMDNNDSSTTGQILV